MKYYAVLTLGIPRKVVLIERPPLVPGCIVATRRKEKRYVKIIRQIEHRRIETIVLGQWLWH